MPQFNVILSGHNVHVQQTYHLLKIINADDMELLQRWLDHEGIDFLQEEPFDNGLTTRYQRSAADVELRRDGTPALLAAGWLCEGPHLYVKSTIDETSTTICDTWLREVLEIARHWSATFQGMNRWPEYKDVELARLHAQRVRSPQMEAVRVKLVEWAQLTGHNLCWHHPEVLQALCKIMSIQIARDPKLPPRLEFRRECQNHEAKLYEEAAIRDGS